MENGEPIGCERILLVGFMGSGKTSVGRALSRLLGWSFRDFDDEIEAEVGLSVPEIFRQKGEPYFRRVEGRVGRRLLKESEVVLATGGGWAAQEGRLQDLPAGTLSVWLRVSPEEAVRRTRGAGPHRPLLATPDPVARARELLAERRDAYREASLILDSESAPPPGLAREILECARVTDAGRGASRMTNG